MVHAAALRAATRHGGRGLRGLCYSAAMAIDADTRRDPVCGMTVNAAASKGGTVEHRGRTYAFCSASCREKFLADPRPYLQSETPPPPAPAGIEYTCPMHPEIVRSAPGSCPICGMALEPRTTSATDEINPELADMTRRFWVSL